MMGKMKSRRCYLHRHLDCEKCSLRLPSPKVSYNALVGLACLEIRERAGLDQMAAAARVGRTQNTISRLERHGATYANKVDIAKKLVESCGTTYERLMMRVTELALIRQAQGFEIIFEERLQ